MSETPVADFLRDYAQGGTLRLHMPGHKGQGEMEALDITEIQGAEPLYSGRGILRESEERAAWNFGTCRTIYSTEGSSLCIRAMVFLARMRAEEKGLRPLILAGRNAHRSFLSAVALMDMEVCWLQGESLLTCQPSRAEVALALEEMETPPAAVYLTSPDYLGNMADIHGIAMECRVRGIPLMVDNAHGAYLAFLAQGLHPIQQGADVVCDSAHKTLPVLTGGAYLHFRRNADPFLVDQGERAMALTASTSPSWLILRSLDLFNGLLAGEMYLESLWRMEEETEALKGRLRRAGFSLRGREPLKITLAAKDYGYLGEELHEYLRREGIECEFSDPDYLVMMLSPGTGAFGLARLERALRALPRREVLPGEPPRAPAPARKLSIRQALLAPAEELPVEKCLGRILAAPSVSCPPAIPILISGEVIGEEAIRCFRYYGISQVSCVREREKH